MPLATPRRRPGPQSRRLQPLCLLEPDCYPHPVGEVELVETHISWVFLAGDYAYKIKKPLHLPFLDARSLLARRRYCEAELRLNRRTAPALYLDVVAVTGTPARPQLGGRGKVIDYALRMRRFDKGCLALELARHGELDDRRIDALAAAKIGRAHV